MVKVERYNTAGVHNDTVHYLYDALDRRVRKVMTNPAGTTVTLDERYLYQPDGALAMVFNQQLAGTVPRQVAVARYASAVDRVLAEEAISGGVAQPPLFFLHDHLGTPRDALQRDSGGVVQLERQYRYDEFGRHIGSYDFNGSTYVASAAPRIGFTGQQYDVETDFNYYQARYYSPRMGRFLSRDPAGFSTGDLNLYRYVGNDPVSLIDPTGMNPATPNRRAPGPNRVGSDPAQFAKALGYQGAGTGTDRGVLDAVSGLGAVTSTLLGSWVQPGFDQYYSTLDSYFNADYARSNGVDQAAATRAAREYRQAHPWLAAAGDLLNVGGDTIVGAGSGLKTGAKAVVNAAADTVVSTVSLGYYDNTELWGVTQQDIWNGYDLAYGSARVSSEIGFGLASGSFVGYLAKGGQTSQLFARGITAFDLTSQSVTIARSGQDIADNGLNVSNGLTFVGSALGLGAQLKSGGIEAIEAGDFSLAGRLDRVHGELGAIERAHRTSAVLETVDGPHIVGGGRRDLTRSQRGALAPDEIAARLPGADAEITVLQQALTLGIAPSRLVTSRAICGNCQTYIEGLGGRVISPRAATWVDP